MYIIEIHKLLKNGPKIKTTVDTRLQDSPAISTQG